MFENHNDLDIDDSDIVQIEENRKIGVTWKSNNDKKLIKSYMYHSHIFLSANFHIYFNTISIISHTKGYFYFQISTIINLWFI